MLSGPLLLAALLLVASATFSGAEAALFTLASQRADAPPRASRRLLADQPGALAVILALNLVVNLSFFASTQVWALGLRPAVEAAAGLGAVFAIVVFGEILPKLFAHRHPLLAARMLLAPVWLAHLLLAPLLRPFGRSFDTARGPRPLDSGETRSLLQEEDSLEDAESLLVRQVLELGQLRAGALRSPLAELARIPAEMPLAAAVSALADEGRAWGAVCGSGGEVLGILDRVRLPTGSTAADAMRPVPVLPEVAPVANGVRLLRESGAPFVLLVDEYGDAAGTIRRGRWADALLDRLPAGAAGEAPLIQAATDGGWLVDAALPLHVFEDRFGFQPDSDVRVDTLGGMLADRLERLPEPGDQIHFDHAGQRCTVTVVQAEETRPVQLALRFSPCPEGPEETEA